jgi:hypothetical protein
MLTRGAHIFRESVMGLATISALSSVGLVERWNGNSGSTSVPNASNSQIDWNAVSKRRGAHIFRMHFLFYVKIIDMLAFLVGSVRRCP